MPIQRWDFVRPNNNRTRRRRLGPVFAEVAAQAANAQQGPKSGQQGVENPNPMPAPSKACKPAHGGHPA